MDDVFYFSERELALGDIAALARARGLSLDYQTEEGFKVRVGDGQWEYSVWAPFPLNDAEPSTAAELRGEGMRSGFCISHHPIAIQALLPFLKRVLLEFGGWVGNDAEGFQPRFSASTIDAFRYAESFDR